MSLQLISPDPTYGIEPGRGSVIDIGAGDNPDDRATKTADLHYDDADYQFDLRDDWPLADGAARGLIANHVFEHIEHEDLPDVFREAHRVLKPGGWLEFSVPVGADLDADPTHKSTWAWRTPDLYVDESAHWIPTIPFSISEKRLHVWMIQPLEVATPFVRFAAKHWPHEAWHDLPGVTGELVVLLRRRSE